MPKYVDVESLHFPNICIFDMTLHGAKVPMVRLVDLQKLVPAADVVERPRWIPVEERLPEKGKYVLVRYKNNDMAVACLFDEDEDILFWRAMTDEGWCADCDTDPTHWMPLPEAPT